MQPLLSNSSSIAVFLLSRHQVIHVVHSWCNPSGCQKPREGSVRCSFHSQEPALAGNHASALLALAEIGLGLTFPRLVFRFLFSFLCRDSLCVPSWWESRRRHRCHCHRGFLWGASAGHCCRWEEKCVKCLVVVFFFQYSGHGPDHKTQLMLADTSAGVVGLTIRKVQLFWLWTWTVLLDW